MKGQVPEKIHSILSVEFTYCVCWIGATLGKREREIKG
jgi:hypothetical protein